VGCRGDTCRRRRSRFATSLLSIERLEDRALALAASLTIDPNPNRRAKNTIPRFNDNVRLLRPSPIARLPTMSEPADSSCRRPSGSSTTFT
jgi:hypothetical protein